MRMPDLNARQVFLDAVKKEYGNVTVISRSEMLAVIEKYDLGKPFWLTLDKANRAGRGLYKLPLSADSQVSQKSETVISKPATFVPEPAVKKATIQIESDSESVVSDSVELSQGAISLVPEKAKGYVPFGNYNDVREIISSRMFYPFFITGLTGNGKTMMVEQVHAELGLEYVRVNITIETDEDDLIGGFRLLDGKTVWQNGPVIVAMERGCTLLLDEVDLGSNKLMCLQPVLEGKSIYLKKINRVVFPAPGFNVCATANTKGKGSDDGRFIGTNVLNEAFLDRFSITMEQDYPAAKVEAKILAGILKDYDRNNIANHKNFVSKLVQWAGVVRKTFKEGAVSEIISTRRLVNICQAYMIFRGDRSKAIGLCLNRFDEDTIKTFMDVYKMIDEKVKENVGSFTPADDVAVNVSDDDIPW